MAPEALPPGYRRFVTGASRVAEPCLPVNLSATRHGVFDPAEARRALAWKGGATPRNAVLIERYAAAADRGDFGTPFAPCAVVHPWVDSCSWTAVDRWHSVFRCVAAALDLNERVVPNAEAVFLFLADRWMFPVYAAL